MRFAESLRMGASECLRAALRAGGSAIVASSEPPGATPDGPAPEWAARQAAAAALRSAALELALAPPGAALESTCIESGWRTELSAAA